MAHSRREGTGCSLGFSSRWGVTCEEVAGLPLTSGWMACSALAGGISGTEGSLGGAGFGVGKRLSGMPHLVSKAVWEITNTKKATARVVASKVIRCRLACLAARENRLQILCDRQS